MCLCFSRYSHLHPLSGTSTTFAHCSFMPLPPSSSLGFPFQVLGHLEEKVDEDYESAPVFWCGVYQAVGVARLRNTPTTPA